MAIAYKVSPRLKQALAKASALPHKEQDEIAAMIQVRISGDDWVAPGTRGHSRIAAIRDLIDTVVPKHPAARTITLTMGSFILFVQAPMMLLMCLAFVVHEAIVPPGGATTVRQVSVGVGASNQSSINVPAASRGPKPVGPAGAGQAGK
jgi:hypothetical protein